MGSEPWIEFYEACNARDPEAIKLIEDGRLGIDDLFAYGAPIHNTAGTNNAELARQLLELGANVNIAKPNDGLTALHVAAGYNHVETARVLLAHGAEVNARTVFAAGSEYTWGPHFGETPLHLACMFCGTDMVQLLLDAGADRDARDGTSAKPFTYLFRKSWVKCEQDVDAMMVLFEKT